MTPHVRTYMKYFGYKIQSDIMCEYCGSPANDVHHLQPRSIAPKHKVNLITNLMGLCREHHERAHREVEFNNALKEVHRRKLLANGLPDNETERYI